MARVELHNVWGLVAALVVSLIATVLKLGDRTQLGAVHLATSLVADVQLCAGVVIWIWAALSPSGILPADMALVVSMSAGALLANVVSVALMVAEIIASHRQR